MIEYVIKVEVDDSVAWKGDTEQFLRTYVADSIWPTVFHLYGDAAQVTLIRNAPNPVEILEHASK